MPETPAHKTPAPEVARRDYRCVECGEVFSVEVGLGDDGPACPSCPPTGPACPACGSTHLWELWESRVRNLGPTSSDWVEELRDRPG